MTTLNQVERLIRRITEAITHPAADPQIAKLAQEYADLCRGATRRQRNDARECGGALGEPATARHDISSETNHPVDHD